MADDALKVYQAGTRPLRETPVTPSISTKPVFTARRRVEFADTDLAGIFHFANFFRYMEDAEHAYYRALGFSVHPDSLLAPGYPEKSAATGQPEVFIRQLSDSSPAFSRARRRASGTHLQANRNG